MRKNHKKKSSSDISGAFKNAPGDRTPDRLRIVFSALDPRDERFVLRIQNEWHMIFQSPRGFSAAPEQGTITFVVVEGASEVLGRPRDIAYQSMRQTILKQCRVGRSKNKEILIRLKFEQPNFVGYVHDYLREMFAEGTPLRHFLPEAIEHFLGESDDDKSLQRSNDQLKKDAYRCIPTAASAEVAEEAFPLLATF